MGNIILKKISSFISGITVSNITRFVRFESRRSFKTFTDDCSNGRREADKDTGDEVAGLIWKLLANSFYGMLNKVVFNEK